MHLEPIIKTLGTLILGFALGVTSSPFVMPLLTQNPQKPSVQIPISHTPPRMNYFIERFSEQLKLSEEQRREVNKIFQTQREKLNSLRQEAMPRFNNIRKQTRDEVRTVLNDEQRKKFDRIHRNRKGRGRKSRGMRKGWQGSRHQWGQNSPVDCS